MSERTPPFTIPSIKPAPVKLNCNGIIFEEILHAEAFRMPNHSHEEAHMALLCKGSIRNFKKNKDSVASTSALMFMPPGETHATQYSDKVHAFYIRFSSAWWERVQESMSVLEEAREYQNSLPSWLAIRIYQEFQKRDNLTPFMLEGLTLELLVAMSRQVNDAGGRGIPRWLRQAQEYLNAHFRQSISLHTVASTAGVHPGHLMRGFRQYYHCTIGDYVRNLRVQNACYLMMDSEQSLSEIALSLGFSDQSHFCKTFKEVTGMTPTEWQSIFGHVRPIQNRLP
jgi:AraC family transcriptional regulator